VKERIMRVRLGIKGMDRIGQDVLRTVERREPAFFVVAMDDERGHAPGILDLVDLIARTPDR